MLVRCAALAVLFFFDLAVCRILTFNVGIRSTYLRISSVRGPSMSGKSDTKVSRHTKNHVAKIGMSGQNLATFRLVADMSPTLPAKQSNSPHISKKNCVLN